MAFSRAELRSMSDEELVTLHDEIARFTQVGLNFYRDELAKRQSEREMAVMRRLTKVSMIVGAISAFAAIAAVVLSILTVLETG